MRRKGCLLIAGTVCFAAVTLEVLWPRHITRSSCNQVRVGMSEGEVEAILGPPGLYHTPLGVLYEQGRVTSDFCRSVQAMNPQRVMKFWACNSVLITVVFDGPGGCVSTCSWSKPIM